MAEEAAGCTTALFGGGATGITALFGGGAATAAAVGFRDVRYATFTWSLVTYLDLVVVILAATFKILYCRFGFIDDLIGRSSSVSLGHKDLDTNACSY